MGIQKKIINNSIDEIYRVPKIIREPGSQETHIGGKIALRIIATGFPLPRYQWFHNGKRINGAVSDRLIINNARKDSVGAYYCETSNEAGTVISRPAMVTLVAEKASKVVIEPGLANIPLGKSFTIYIALPEQKIIENYQVRWFLNGKKIKNATESILKLSEVKTKYQGVYKAMLTMGSHILSSNECTLNIVNTDAEVEELPSRQIETADKKDNLEFFNPEESEQSVEELPVASTHLDKSTKIPEQKEEDQNPHLKKKASILQKFNQRFENLKHKKVAS